MERSSNSYQIGGSHYKNTGYEHWDLVLRLGMGYLEGNATKYIARWNKKSSAADDLAKAIHYVNKLLENILLVNPKRRPLRFIQREVNQFCVANELGPFESDAVMKLATWETDRDLIAARNCIDHVVGQFAGGRSLQYDTPLKVPLTDSNKHAERSTTEGNT